MLEKFLRNAILNKNTTIWGSLLSVLLPEVFRGYIDPATGKIRWEMVLAAVLGVIVSALTKDAAVTGTAKVDPAP